MTYFVLHRICVYWISTEAKPFTWAELLWTSFSLVEWLFLSLVNNDPGTGTWDIIHIFGKQLNAGEKQPWYLSTMEKNIHVSFIDVSQMFQLHKSKRINFSLKGKKKNKTQLFKGCLKMEIHMIWLNIWIFLIKYKYNFD